MRRILWLMLLLCLLAGCARPSEPVGTEPTEILLPAETTIPATEETVIPSREVQVLAELPPEPVSVILQPEASGILEARCDYAVVDYSHTCEGYVMVRYTTQTEKRLKVLVKGPTTTYSYNLPVDEWTVFPLSDGNGDYQVGVYINARDSKYATVMSVEFSVELEDEFAPFLRPNQYVDYSQAANTVAKGAELTVGLSHPLDKVAVVYDYVVGNLSYDHEKAATVKSGYLPVLDQVLEEKKGICFDYAALMTAMLRSQGVPCKLVVGYAGDVYHAWISVWMEDRGWIDGAVFFDGQRWKRMDPTFASSGGRSEEIMEFIEHGDYRVKYLY